MKGARELVINKGEEFKLSVKDNIDETDIFYDQFINAARMLDDIVAMQDDSETWYKTECENNIIAFCGERGEGKSSAMISFVKAVYDDSGNSIFTGCENIKQTCFAEPIIIDPSMLDEVHNVLDIVLATLYRKFREKYDENNQFVQEYKREELLDQFQKVYKCISLINNQEKMLDDEYDYEGNISKLSKLGQGTGLRKELQKLVTMYLAIMPVARKENRKSGCLLIAIDDLDLCSFHAYRMAEQIRKYLMIPNVAIVMALKVEQLQLCVQEQNLRNYENIAHIKGEEGEIFEEVSNMSERYVAKLIPKVRRNYLPNVQTMHNVNVLYKGKSDADTLRISMGKSVNEAILYLINRKTGMKFLTDKSGKNYFLPDNLRDTVNIIVLLAGMEEPEGDNSIYYDNILKFSNFYERQWLFSNLNLEGYKEIQKLVHAQVQLHEKVTLLLYSRNNAMKEKNNFNPAQFSAEINDSFFIVMSWLETYRKNVLGEEEKKYAYVFQILYTIRMNELLRLEQYNELTNFMGGYIWAGNFQNVLPYVLGTMIDRSRFELSTLVTYNVLARKLWADESILLSESQKGQCYVTEISENDENRKAKIVTWLLLGMLSNTWYKSPSYQLVYAFDTAQVIAANHSIIPKLHISLENYIVSLCSLESVYKKVNMEYLGVSIDDFREVIKEIQESNEKTIEAFRGIVANIDIAMEFKEYCIRKKDIKEYGYKDDIERTRTAVSIFFRNAENFIKDYLNIEIKNIECFKLGYDNGITEINICDIYALLVQAGVMEDEARRAENANGQNKEELIKSFASKLRNRAEPGLSLERVSSYLVTKTAKNAKENMDSLASNIQRYYSAHGEEKLEEAEISNLCSLYGKIIDAYLISPVEKISDDICEEYKNIVKRYIRTCR